MIGEGLWREMTSCGTDSIHLPDEYLIKQLPEGMTPDAPMWMSRCLYCKKPLLGLLSPEPYDSDGAVIARLTFNRTWFSQPNTFLIHELP